MSVETPKQRGEMFAPSFQKSYLVVTTPTTQSKSRTSSCDPDSEKHRTSLTRYSLHGSLSYLGWIKKSRTIIYSSLLSSRADVKQKELKFSDALSVVFYCSAQFSTDNNPDKIIKIRKCVKYFKIKFIVSLGRNIN